MHSSSKDFSLKTRAPLASFAAPIKGLAGMRPTVKPGLRELVIGLFGCFILNNKMDFQWPLKISEHTQAQHLKIIKKRKFEIFFFLLFPTIYGSLLSNWMPVFIGHDGFME